MGMFANAGYGVGAMAAGVGIGAIGGSINGLTYGGIAGAMNEGDQSQTAAMATGAKWGAAGGAFLGAGIIANLAGKNKLGMAANIAGGTLGFFGAVSAYNSAKENTTLESNRGIMLG